MPSPVAHSLVGAGAFLVLTPGIGLKPLSFILWEKKEDILFLIVMAILPDLDMIVGLLLYHNADTFHGLFSHSLLGALLMALAASFIYSIGNRKRTFLVAFTLMVLHDLMDFSASPNLIDPGSGVSLFFPFSEKIASPFPIFFGFRHTTIQQLISLHNLRSIGIELLEFSTGLFILYQLKKNCFIYDKSIKDRKPLYLVWRRGKSYQK